MERHRAVRGGCWVWFPALWKGCCSPGVHRDLPQGGAGVFFLIKEGILHTVPKEGWGGSDDDCQQGADLTLSQRLQSKMVFVVWLFFVFF